MKDFYGTPRTDIPSDSDMGALYLTGGSGLPRSPGGAMVPPGAGTPGGGNPTPGGLPEFFDDESAKATYRDANRAGQRYREITKTKRLRRKELGDLAHTSDRIQSAFDTYKELDGLFKGMGDVYGTVDNPTQAGMHLLQRIAVQKQRLLQLRDKDLAMRERLNKQYKLGLPTIDPQTGKFVPLERHQLEGIEDMDNASFDDEIGTGFAEAFGAIPGE